MTECCSSGEMAGQEDVAERQKKNNNKKKFHRACKCNYVKRPSAGTTDAEFVGAAANLGQLSLLSFSFVTHLKEKKKGHENLFTICFHIERQVSIETPLPQPQTSTHEG